MKKQKAFTLIEILVVVTIIGILATLAIISLSEARSRARDVKRVADVRQMQTALEVFYYYNGRYPDASEFQIGGQLISPVTGVVLMNQIPTAPAVADGNCDSSEYSYTALDDGAGYEISFCVGKEVSGLPAGNLIASEEGINNGGFLCGDIFTDTRDGNTYNTVQIGSQCWMAENLKYLPAVYPSAEGSNSAPYYHVYDYQGYNIEEAKATANYNTHGVLYNWTAAMDWDGIIATTELGGAQGICPDGWHVPTDNEWKMLEGTVDSTYEMSDAVWNGYGFRGDDVATKLKSSSSDTPPWDGTNSSGFKALDSGVIFGPGSFNSMGYRIYFWSSSVSGSYVWNRSVYDFYSQVSRSESPFNYSFYLRCLRTAGPIDDSIFY